MWDSFVGLFERALALLEGVTHSWGLAIVLLTVVLRLALWPLTWSQVVSSRRLQAIQPEMERLRERYKKDPQRLNQEVVKLWREHKVNPLSGCFPLLLQLPFLWAIYQVLLRSQELKGASFLWVANLGAPDAWILPLLAGISTFVQTWMITPRGAGQQPSQQMFLWVMPAMIVVISRTLPAGVVVYWVTSNLFSIGQQLLVPGVGAARGKARAS